MYCYAEAALAEANILDHSNAAVWGALCLVALLSGRVGEAEQALGTAFRVNLTDAALLAEIGKLFLQAGKWKHAEGALRRAAKSGGGGGDVRVALGRALLEQNDVEAAKVGLLYKTAVVYPVLVWHEFLGYICTQLTRSSLKAHGFNP